jgi:hypothetical protein
MELRVNPGRFEHSTAKLAMLVVLCVLGFFVPAGFGAGQVTPGSGAVARANFAIADFDGDRKPDLASVEVQSAGSRWSTRYSIRFELTAGAPQNFGVTAPAGGLQIIARDVNGDNVLDLLVSTAWQNKAVAILLNDGHGKFTLVDPSVFPAATGEADSAWNAGTPLWCESPALMRSNNSSGEFEPSAACDGPERQVESVRAARAMAANGLLLYSLLGRAPPAFGHQA